MCRWLSKGMCRIKEVVKETILLFLLFGKPHTGILHRDVCDIGNSCFRGSAAERYPFPF